MPRKNILAPVAVIPGITMGADITQGVTAGTKDATNVQFLDNIGVQLNWTGTPTGEFFIDVSLDNSNWNELSLSPAPVAAGSANSAYIDLNQLSTVYIRIRYVRTSGTGTLTGYLTGKEV